METLLVPICNTNRHRCLNISLPDWWWCNSLVNTYRRQKCTKAAFIMYYTQRGTFGKNEIDEFLMEIQDNWERCFSLAKEEMALRRDRMIIACFVEIRISFLSM